MKPLIKGAVLAICALALIAQPVFAQPTISTQKKQLATKASQNVKPKPKTALAPSTSSRPTAKPKSVVRPKKVTSKKLISKPAVQKKDYSAITGSYRCWSYNVSGGGSGNCRLFAPIVLKKNGTYSVSSEKGTFTLQGSTIKLSQSKLRGPGTLIQGNQLRFEYDYNGWHHVITYLKESNSSSKKSPSLVAVSEVPVQVILEYPDKDSTLGSIATIELVPQEDDIKKASYKPTAIAVWDGDRRVVGSFSKATNTPKVGKKYSVYANWGAQYQGVGVLDLTRATSEVKAVLRIQKYDDGGIPTPAEQTEVKQSSASEIVVEIDLVYPERDSSLGSITFITLVLQGENPATAIYKPMALAVWDGERTINASFHKATNQVKTGAKYTVYADWGSEMIKSGTLDLTSTSNGPVKKTFETTISGK